MIQVERKATRMVDAKPGSQLASSRAGSQPFAW